MKNIVLFKNVIIAFLVTLGFSSCTAPCYHGGGYSGGGYSHGPAPMRSQSMHVSSGFSGRQICNSSGEYFTIVGQASPGMSCPPGHRIMNYNGGLILARCVSGGQGHMQSSHGYGQPPPGYGRPPGYGSRPPGYGSQGRNPMYHGYGQPEGDPMYYGYGAGQPQYPPDRGGPFYGGPAYPDVGHDGVYRPSVPQSGSGRRPQPYPRRY